MVGQRGGQDAYHEFAFVGSELSWLEMPSLTVLFCLADWEAEAVKS